MPPASSSSRNRKAKRNSSYGEGEGDRERLLGEETNADDAEFTDQLDDERQPLASGPRDAEDDTSSTKTVCLF